MNIDTKTDWQKEFEAQTPTIIGVPDKEYLRTFCTWLHFQLDKQIEMNKRLTDKSQPEVCDYCMEMKDNTSIICSDCATENNM